MLLCFVILLATRFHRDAQVTSFYREYKHFVRGYYESCWGFDAGLRFRLMLKYDTEQGAKESLMRSLVFVKGRQLDRMVQK